MPEDLRKSVVGCW